MGRVGLFVVFSCIPLLAHSTVGSRVYAANQDKQGSSSPGDVPLVCLEGKLEPINLKIDGLASSSHVDLNESSLIQSSSGQGSLPAGGGPSRYFAGYGMSSQRGYYGIEATTDVYSFSLDQEQQSGSVITISNLGDHARSNINAIHIGWHINPVFYGDSYTRFFVYWTSDGYQNTGCYNLKCPGYQPEDNTRVVPGSRLDAGSIREIKVNITYKVFKDSTTGDWVVHCGFDSEPYLIGRFPKTLFTTLNNKADDIKLFGNVESLRKHLPPMGSGFPSDSPKAASFSNVHLIDQNGKPSRLPKDLKAYVRNGAIYSVSPVTPDGKFTYGGPST